MSSARLKRQVDSILASLDVALDADSRHPAPPERAADPLPSQSSLDSPSAPPIPPPIAPPPSPFSIASGTALLGASRGLFAPAGSANEHSAQLARPTHDGCLTLSQLETLVDSATPQPAGCRPYEYADYLQRVATFRMAFFWFDMPDELSPPQCARHGWCLSSRETLGCTVCGSYIKTPHSLLSSAAGPLSAQLAAQLATAHRELCPWRGSACPESFASLLLPGRHGAAPSLPKGRVQTREALRQRARSLHELQPLPALAPTTDEPLAECARLCGLATAKELLAALKQLAGPPPNSSRTAADEEATERALVLAALGWQASASVPHAIECPEDGRTVGLWRHGAAPRPAAAPAVEPSASAPRFGGPSRPPNERTSPVAPRAAGASAAASAEPLDPIGAHRSWSPWLRITPSDTHPTWMRCIALLGPAAAAPPAASTPVAVSRASQVLSELRGLV
ncbi:hypothetical protein AB1Y20_018369 [Prymnesium parvum]|uniref:C3HC-type domain-containing protein n=1 Tax=Prymnesium parvum TaxID=97485 RepID=A0AB34JP20_PRYPA